MGGSALAANLLRARTLHGEVVQDPSNNVKDLPPHGTQMIPQITIISGPTCCGKTRRAMEEALAENAEIISCDSVQVYRGMDIGSDKAPAEDRAKIPHHLIDVADVSEGFDIARYVELAKEALADICSRGKNIIVAGGSGFYLKSWFAAVADSIQIPAKIKKICADTEKFGGVRALAEALLKLDSNAAESIDMMNPRRVKNALERVMASGKTVAKLREEFESSPCPYGELSRKIIMLDMPDSDLNSKIAARSAGMIERGIIEETRALISAGILKNPSASKSIGYRETIDWISSGERDTAALRDSITAHTIALVKKQRKFLRTQIPFHNH